MKKITFTLDILTPVFSTGGYPGDADIRPASIKGLMRYWYRALIAENDLKTLHKKENEIFGSTEEGAKVGIRVRGNLKTKKKYKFNYHKQGIQYLWYSIKMNQKNDKKGKDFIPPGQQFKIELFSLNNPKALQQAALSLWLLTTLGGLGSRQRRGGGSLRLSAIEDNYGLLKDKQLIYSGDSQNYLSYLKRTIKDIARELGQGNTQNYSNLQGAELYLIQPENKRVTSDYQESLNFIGEKFREFRNYYQDDYNVVKGFLNGEGVRQTVEKAAFGLPLMYFYRSQPRGKNRANITATGDINRRSSPLIIKITKIKDRYYPLVVHMNGEFLPENTKLLLKNKRKEDEADLPDSGVINEFINSLNEVKIAEVKL